MVVRWAAPLQAGSRNFHVVANEWRGRRSWNVTGPGMFWLSLTLQETLSPERVSINEGVLKDAAEQNRATNEDLCWLGSMRPCWRCLIDRKTN